MADAPNELKIVLKKASDLLAMDKAMFGGKASSDPYVKFSCGGREAKSSTKKKTLNPAWDEALSLEVLSSEAELLVEVYDADLVGADYIGHTVVAVGSLRDGAMSREARAATRAPLSAPLARAATRAPLSAPLSRAGSRRRGAAAAGLSLGDDAQPPRCRPPAPAPRARCTGCATATATTTRASRAARSSSR
jgi:hypothetical protein